MRNVSDIQLIYIITILIKMIRLIHIETVTSNISLNLKLINTVFINFN